MNNNYVYIDCQFYGFYIKKSELKKYNLSEKDIKNHDNISPIIFYKSYFNDYYNPKNSNIKIFENINLLKKIVKQLLITLI